MGSIIVSIIFSLTGFSGLAWSTIMIYRSIQSKRWIPTKCVILSSTVEEDRGDGIEFRPVIRYKYFYDGLDYEGETVGIGSLNFYHTQKHITYGQIILMGVPKLFM